MKPRFFRSAAEFRQWLERRHASVTDWVTSAKQDATKERRLALLVRASERGLRFGALTGARSDRGKVSRDG